MQVSNFISAKVNYYFRDSHVSKGNYLDKVTNNLKCFTDVIDLPKWHEERTHYIDEVIGRGVYEEVLKIYNNKGLKKICNEQFKIKDFSDMAIRFLQREPKTHDILRKVFPR